MAIMQTPTIAPIALPRLPSVNVGYAAGAQTPQAQDVTGSDLLRLGKGVADVTDGASVFNNVGRATSLPSGVANAVDSFGRSVGVGSLAPVPGPSLPNVYGPAPNGVGTANGLSGNFNAANMGAGMAGGFAANAVFGGGVGTSVGSTVGGIIGSFGGPVGAFVGSFIGGGIGSMFGKKKPSNRLQVGGINMATGEYDAEGSKLFSQKDNKYSEQNAKTRDAYSMAAADMTKFLRDSGVQPTGEIGNLVVRVGDRSGMDYFFEQPTTSAETTDFRGSQRNAELMNKTDAERNIQSFGKDPAKFQEGLQNGILEKFSATPELAEQARAIFNKRLAEGGALPGQGQGTAKPLQKPMPMVAARTSTWDEYMNNKIASEAPKEPAPAAKV